MPFAFAPYHYPFIALLSIASFFYIILISTPPSASVFGFIFGLGMFGVGVNWLHISINLFGGINLAVAVMITFGLIIYLALYPALVAYAYHRLCHGTGLIVFTMTMPALWVLAEWCRAWALTGFPWLSVGYSQIDTRLSALAPVLGLYGVSWLTTCAAALLVVFCLTSLRTKAILVGLISIASFTLGKFSDMQWSTEQTRTLSVALIQGAIPQAIKWQPDQRWKTLELYSTLSREYHDHQLIIWPETAIPMFYHQAEQFIDEMITTAQAEQLDYLTGVPFYDPDTQKFYNGIAVIGAHNDRYYKQHLVPFGEYLPFDTWLRPLLDFISIPLSDFSPGPPVKPIVRAANEAIGVSVCYEDVFGEEVIMALPEAGVLVNISNDAWFGDSIAPHQHLQMARMRALETGRYMLRATNTGISAIIDEKGGILSRSLLFTPHALSGDVKIFAGLTPYARFGNAPVIIATLLAVLIMSFVSKWRRKI